MKSKSVSYALLMTAMLASCGDEADIQAPDKECTSPQPTVSENSNPEAVLMTFKAGYGNPVSKTAISNVSDLVFSMGDEISVFDGNLSSKYTSDIADGTSATCNFTGYSYQSGTYHAIYPSGASIGTGKASATVPSAQTAVAGSFDKAAHIMVASAQSDYFVFNTVNAFLMLTAPKDLSSLELVANGICGSLEITPENGDYSKFNVSSASGNTITLSGDIKQGSSYYIAIAPGTYTDGITLKMYSSDGLTGVYTTKKSFEVEPNALKKFSDLSAKVDFKPGSKGLATYLSQFSDGENVTLELQDCDDWSSLRSALLKKTNLKVAIKLPEGITDIPAEAFYGCKNLVSVEIPNGVTSLGNYCFKNCAKLESVKLPTDLTTIGRYSFDGCSKLAITELPAGIQDIQAGAFYDCTAVALAELPSSLVTIGEQAFYNCTSLAITTIPVSVTNIGRLAFGNCTNLRVVTIEGNPELGSSIFADAKYISAIYITESAFDRYGEKVFYPKTTKIGYTSANLKSNLLSSTKSDISFTLADYNEQALREALLSINGTGKKVSVKVLNSASTKVGEEAFKNCTSLVSIDLPASVVEFGKYCFDCNSITKVTIRAHEFQLPLNGNGKATIFGENNSLHRDVCIYQHVPDYINNQLDDGYISMNLRSDF